MNTVGEFFFTISLDNKAQEQLLKAEQVMMNIVIRGEKKKQAEINKTTSFWRKQSNLIQATGKQFTNFFTNLAGGLTAFSAAASVGTLAINSLMNATTQFANEQLKAQAIAGISTERLQGLANAYSNLSNISMSQATNELAEFAMRIERAKAGMESPLQLMLAGVNFSGKTTLDSAINDLRANLGGRSDQDIMQFLDAGNLPRDLFYFIKASREELEMLNSMPVISQEQLNDIKKAGQGFSMLKNLVGGIIKQAQANIAPFLRLEFERLFKVINMNRGKIISFIEDVTKFIGMFIVATGRALSVVAEFIGKLFNSKKGFQIMVAGIGLLLARAKPFWLLLGGIIALLEEFWAWRQDGGGPLAGFFEGATKVYDVINSIIPVAKLLEIGLLTMAGVAVVGRILALVDALSKVNLMMGLISKSKAFMIIGGAIAGFQGLQDIFTDSDNLGIKAKMENWSETDAGKKYFNMIQGPGKRYEIDKFTPERIIKPINKTGNNNVVNTNQNITINVGNRGDASEVADEVASRLREETNHNDKVLEFMAE